MSMVVMGGMRGYRLNTSSSVHQRGSVRRRRTKARMISTFTAIARGERRTPGRREGCFGPVYYRMIVDLLDGTYELYRQFYGRRRFNKGEDPPYGGGLEGGRAGGGGARRRGGGGGRGRPRGWSRSASGPTTRTRRSAFEPAGWCRWTAEPGRFGMRRRSRRSSGS